MTPITDKIKQLPDGCPLFKAALPISEVPFYSDDLKSLSQRVKDLEAALGMIAGLHQCPDNLMSDKDIARAALEKKQ